MTPAARLLVLAAVLAAGAAFPGVAPAATVTTPNACQYSYDDLWRPLPIALGGQASVASARAGDEVTLSGQTFALDLPAWLAETGYQFGLLHEGDNEIEVSVWVALRATNTVQDARWERLDGTAETTIDADAQGNFVSATPITYSVSPPPAAAWRAKGGRIAFAQAPPGALPAIPVGPQDALRTPKGSIFILAKLGSTLRLGLDCAPGVNDPDGGGYDVAAAAPFATTAVPAFECLGAVPAATNLTGVDVELLGPASGAAATAGAALAVAGSLRYRIPNATLAALYGAGRLAVGANAFAATFDVALASANGAPATQTVRVQTSDAVTVTVGAGGAPITVSGPGGASADVDGTIALPSSWTAVSAGRLTVGGAGSGSLGPFTPAGAIASVAPYGGVLARLAFTPAGEAARYASADCVSGRTAVASAAIAYSERGNQAGGDQGRFAITAYAPDPFASIAVSAPAADPPAGGGGGDVAPPPGGGAPVDPAAGRPPAGGGTAPAPRRAAARPSLRSTRLALRGGRVAVVLGCPQAAATCRGSLTLRSGARVRVRSGGAARVVTLSKRLRYTVLAGRSKTVSLTLTRDGLAVARRGKSMRVRLVALPTGSAVVSKLLTLRR